MTNGNGRNGKHNAEDAVAFSNIFDFTDPMLGEQYTRRREPVVGTSETGKGSAIDLIVPSQKNRGWMSSWEKGRKRVATSPVSFHADEVLPMLEGLSNKSDSLGEPFRDIQGMLFGGKGKERKGPMYGLSLNVRMQSLAGDIKRGDDILDCYVRGLETPTRRKTYALQQPPSRSFGLGGPTRDIRDRELKASKTVTDLSDAKLEIKKQSLELSGLREGIMLMRKQGEAMGIDKQKRAIINLD